jgi:large subunit ribosomal protein L5
MTPRIKELYQKELVPRLTEKFGYPNLMAVPRLAKIVVNMGVGKAQEDIKLLDSAMAEMAQITGQRPSIRRARKSIANFKLREGSPIGCRVTLRGDRMYEFLDRLVAIALPRVRDFRGISTKAFDGRGNYTMGIEDQLIFPEISYTKVDMVRGMNVSIVTTARSDDESRALLEGLGMPFRRS